jgi:hypothetical protein
VFSSRDIDSAEEVVSLFEVELYEPRNLSAHESEECDNGKGVGVYFALLQSDTIAIWSHKSRYKTWGGWSPQKNKGPERK